MKSSQQIVDHIDRYISYALERPQNYARDAIDLEYKLYLLDHIRQYAIADDDAGLDHIRSPYAEYLGEQNYGVMTFTTAKHPPEPEISAEKLSEFREFTDFWQGYLEWRDRK